MIYMREIEGEEERAGQERDRGRRRERGTGGRLKENKKEEQKEWRAK